MRKQQPKILIVDDDKILCELLAEQLEESNFMATYSLSGPEAIGKIKNEKYNLVILNQNMPGMRGDEVLVEIKTFDSTIPVIMLSGQSDPSIIVKCVKLGAVDYFTKPYEYDDLLSSVIANQR